MYLPHSYDASNSRLEADLAEVRAAATLAAALCPRVSAAAASAGDPRCMADGKHVGDQPVGDGATALAVLRERAEARFGLKDFEGAAEAFEAMAALHQVCWRSLAQGGWVCSPYMQV
jgi:hypothetical protein